MVRLHCFRVISQWGQRGKAHRIPLRDMFFLSFFLSSREITRRVRKVGA